MKRYTLHYLNRKGEARTMTVRYSSILFMQNVLIFKRGCVVTRMTEA